MDWVNLSHTVLALSWRVIHSGLKLACPQALSYRLGLSDGTVTVIRDISTRNHRIVQLAINFFARAVFSIKLWVLAKHIKYSVAVVALKSNNWQLLPKKSSKSATTFVIEYSKSTDPRVLWRARVSKRMRRTTSWWAGFSLDVTRGLSPASRRVWRGLTTLLDI